MAEGVRGENVYAKGVIIWEKVYKDLNSCIPYCILPYFL